MDQRFAIVISGSDRSGPAFSSLSKRMDEAKKKTSGMADGLGSLTRPVDKVANAFSALTGKGDLRATLKDVAQLGGNFAKLGAGVEGAAGSIGALGGMAASATGSIVGLTAAYVGLVAMSTKLVAPFARSGQEIQRTAATLGVSTKFLQSFRGAAEGQGLDKDAASGALLGIGSTLNSVQNGTNPLASSALTSLGIKMKDVLGKDGIVDPEKGALLLADRISRIKNPYGQLHAAEIFGATSALPLLRQGSGPLQKGMDEYWSTGAGQDAGQLKKSAGFGRGLTNFEHSSYGVAKDLATGSMPFLGRNVSLGAHGIHVARDLGAAGLHVARAAVNHLVGTAAAGGRRPALGLTLNNPGNLRPPGSKKGFAHYATMSDGIAAMARQLRRDQQVHKLNTLEELISDPVWGYAPRQDHNDVSAYLSDLERKTGIGRKQRLDLSDPNQLSTIEQAMISHETGGSFSRDRILQDIGATGARGAPANAVRGAVDVRVKIDGPPGTIAHTRYSGDVTAQTNVAHAMKFER